jgi:hypothetical protein
VLAACASDVPPPDEPGLELGPVAGESKEDSIGARRVVLLDRDDIDIEATDYMGFSTVLSVTDDAVRVRSDRVVLYPELGDLVQITSEPVGILDGITQTIGFVLFYRAPGGSWTLVEVPASYGDTAFNVFLFDEVLIDPGTEQMDLNAIIGTNYGLTEESATIPFADVGTTQLEWGVAPVPVGAWGDLEGDYDYLIRAGCGDGDCTPGG